MPQSLSSTVSTASSNLTKYYAGGSGDNVISDGYIKTVEKLWIDSYTFAFTNTLTSIQIAELPVNKKIVGIQIEIYTTITQTSGTVSVGFVRDTADILLTTGCADFLPPTTLTHNLTRTSISIPGAFYLGSGNLTNSTLTVSAHGSFPYVTTGTNTTIGIKLNNWIMTTGTIKTIVRYV